MENNIIKRVLIREIEGKLNAILEIHNLSDEKKDYNERKLKIESFLKWLWDNNESVCCKTELNNNENNAAPESLLNFHSLISTKSKNFRNNSSWYTISMLLTIDEAKVICVNKNDWKISAQ